MFIEAQILTPVLSGLSLTLDAIVAWFHGSRPRSWLSHAVVWFLVQSGGGLIDTAIGSGRPPKRAFRLLAFGGACLFYGIRETLDTARGLVIMDWVLIGDSLMDFFVPAVLNTLVLAWLIRSDARGLAAGERAADPDGDAASGGPKPATTARSHRHTSAVPLGRASPRSWTTSGPRATSPSSAGAESRGTE